MDSAKVVSILLIWMQVENIILIGITSSEIPKTLAIRLMQKHQHPFLQP